jgi:hypothetical protein
MSHIPRYSHVHLSDVLWDNRKRRSALWPSVSSVCTAGPVDMSHDRCGSYSKLTAVWGAVGKYRFVVVKILCCENARERESALTSSWLTLFLLSSLLFASQIKYVFVVSIRSARPQQRRIL